MLTITGCMFLKLYLTNTYNNYESTITIKPISDFEIVWNWTSNHCFDKNLPDIPARVYKDDNNSIIFMD